MVSYPIGSGQMFNIVLLLPASTDTDVGKWSQPGDISEARRMIELFCTQVKRIWTLVDSCAKWTIGCLPPLPSFTSDSGRLMLVGDAAHAIVPHVAQGGAMALEDAATLAELISSISDKSELPSRMRVWNALRQERVSNIRRVAESSGDFQTIPDGSQQRRRDEALATSTKA